jgi:hypothetical protein
MQAAGVAGVVRIVAANLSLAEAGGRARYFIGTKTESA